MCNITGNYSKKSFTGYKVVCEMDGKYYSPATGIEYKKGPVEIPVVQQRLCNWFSDTLLLPDGYGYKPDMKGYTAVFVNQYNAMCTWKELAFWYDSPYKLKVVKMTISHKLQYGTYGHDNVILGKRIDKIEEVCV